MSRVPSLWAHNGFFPNISKQEQVVKPPWPLLLQQTLVSSLYVRPTCTLSSLRRHILSPPYTTAVFLAPISLLTFALPRTPHTFKSRTCLQCLLYLEEATHLWLSSRALCWFYHLLPKASHSPLGHGPCSCPSSPDLSLDLDRT